MNSASANIYPIRVAYRNSLFRKEPVVIYADTLAGAALGKSSGMISRNDVAQRRTKLWVEKHIGWATCSSADNGLYARMKQEEAAIQLNHVEAMLGNHQSKWRLAPLATAFTALAVGGLAVKDAAIEHVVKPLIAAIKPATYR